MLSKSFAFGLALLFLACKPSGKSSVASEPPAATTAETPVETTPAPVVEAGTLAVGLQYLAENVLFPIANAQGAYEYPITEGMKVDRDTKVLAGNILLANADDALALTDTVSTAKTLGRLKSANLKDALVNELAVDLAETIIGTWKITEAYTGTGDLPEGITEEILKNSEVSFGAAGTISFKNCFRFFGNTRDHCEEGISHHLHTGSASNSTCNAMVDSEWIDLTAYTTIENTFLSLTYTRHYRNFQNCNPGFEHVVDTNTPGFKQIMKIESLTKDKIVLSNLPGAVLILERKPS